MKKLFLFPLIFAAHFVVGQETFNKRHIFGFEAAVLTSVLPTDSCYYATGIIADTVFPFNTGNIFAKLDLSGEPVLLRTVEHPEKTYETWEHSLHRLDGGNFVNSGYSFDTTMSAFLVKYGTEGDTFSYTEYPNPFSPGQTFIRPRAFSVCPDGGFIFACQIGVGTSGGFQDADIYLLKVDSLGAFVWDRVIGDGLWDVPHSVAVATGGGIYTGARKSNTNMAVSGYTYQCHILKADGEGNVEWEWLSPVSAGLRDAANDMLLLGDGSLVVASGVGHEIDNPSVNAVVFDKHIFKLGPQQEVEWELTFPSPLETGRTVATTLVELSDGSGYVMAGTEIGTLPPPAYGIIYGWLGKVSPEGDSVWTRRHGFLTDHRYYHKVYDLKETPDGGLVLCGEALDEASGATYPQQAWLLKLDGHGCLVPGCHLADSAGETEGQGLELAIHPNPAVDYLNFQLRGAALRGFQNPEGLGSLGRFRIIDTQGTVVEEFENKTPEATFSVPVWDWAAGVYFLQYLKNGEVRVTEKFVVGR